MSPIIFLILVACTFANQDNETQFIYNGFHGSNELVLDGLATIRKNGLLQLTNSTPQNTSHAFYPNPINFKPNRTSFSTTFVFAINAQVPNHSGNGMAFVISPTTNFKHALPSLYLGLFNDSTKNQLNYTNQSYNHLFAIELDTVRNTEVHDIDNNHVGIDINSLISVGSASAAYYSDKEKMNRTLQLNSGKPMQLWIDYDKVEMLVNVTLAPLGFPKPSKLLLSHFFNLSNVLLDSMYVGFSSSTAITSNSHYVLGWSWNQSGKAQDFDHSRLPSLPRIKHKQSLSQLIFVILLIIVLLLLVMIGSAALFYWRKKYAELLESWEKEYAPHSRFSYKDLYAATKGFKDTELLGVGGFGKVYKGVLPSGNNTQVAVKRVSHDSRQGMKEFVAEISSMRRLRHRNLVQLLGYCRRKGELILVYEYMANGSLDKFLFGNEENSNLSWPLRFKVIKGVASALLYLHEEWEQVVLHRDVKAGNVLLDTEMNAKLGDFGLARLYDHDIDPRTTHVVGTIGYIAPELSRTQKPTTKSDVYAFGMFLLEVGCGRRPIRKQDSRDAEEVFLSDWVCDCWKRGVILKAADPKIEGHYQKEEMELVLKLGLQCMNPKAEARPTMRQAVQYLDGSVSLPEIPTGYEIDNISYFGIALGGLSSFPSSIPSSSRTAASGFMSSSNSVLQSGR